MKNSAKRIEVHHKFPKSLLPKQILVQIPKLRVLNIFHLVFQIDPDDYKIIVNYLKMHRMQLLIEIQLKTQLPSKELLNLFILIQICINEENKHKGKF